MPTIDYHIRIDQELQEQVFPILASHGLTPVQAFNLFLAHIKRTGEIPLTFEQHTGKTLTPQAAEKLRQSIRETEQGDYGEYATIEAFMDAMAKEQP